MPKIPTNYPNTKTKDENQLSDEELKSLAIEQYQKKEAKEYNYPSETVTLPSRGKLYPEANPLSSGQIEMKYMTAKEEDILTSQNLIRAGLVLDKLFQSMILSNINYNDLLIGDKNSIMIAARILGYGKDYNVEITCPKCDHTDKVVVDLTKVQEKLMPEDANMIEPNVFEFTLPQTKRVVRFKILSHYDDKKIKEQLEINKKANKNKKDAVDTELSTRLKNIIISVDGNSDKDVINNFVDNELFAMDSRALRNRIAYVQPDQPLEIWYQCSDCGHEEESISVELTTEFFWPRA